MPGGVAAAIAVGALAPGASAELRPLTPQEFLTTLAESELDAFSGTVVVRTDLGVPTQLLDQLAGDGAGGHGGPSSGGEDVYRVWKDGTKARVSMASMMGEQKLVVNDGSVLLFDSATQTAKVGDLSDVRDGAPPPAEEYDVPGPAEAARMIVEAIEPTTTLTVLDPRTVAGRPAYVLQVEPDESQSDSLVRSATIAMDAATGAPVAVEVVSRSGTTAVDGRYTRFAAEPPPDDVFSLDLPEDVTIETMDGTADRPPMPSSPVPDLGSQATVVGEGWTAVAVLPPGSVDLAGLAAPGGDDASAVLDALLVPYGDSGARVLTSELLTVMVLPDGAAAVGAVVPERLEQVLTGSPTFG